ncbi:hypothetical protein BC827DRAFT_257376 [Russula dissimulans]|nr:hypothetical protein BC827DRAFT_257376 [Russula dissimulans]
MRGARVRQTLCYPDPFGRSSRFRLTGNCLAFNCLIDGFLAWRQRQRTSSSTHTGHATFIISSIHAFALVHGWDAPRHIYVNEVREHLAQTLMPARPGPRLPPLRGFATVFARDERAKDQWCIFDHIPPLCAVMLRSHERSSIVIVRELFGGYARVFHCPRVLEKRRRI